MTKEIQKNTEQEPGLKPKDMVDHYRIIRPLGAGGMAEVYLARDTMLGRKVALKIVHSKRTDKKDTVQRFLFEAKATARFNHPNIVTVYSVGIASSGPYLALEYLEGQSLRKRLEQECLSVKESIRIAIAIAKALAAAHKEKILHRDLKPDNVMLARDGKLRVLDFGLSHVLRDPETIDSGSGEDDIFKTSILKDPFISKQQGLKGTPAYMSPEQWKAEKISPSSDIWALGMILYEMVFGKHPYHDVVGMHVLASRIASADPVPMPDLLVNVPYDLMELTKKCLEKNEPDRPTAKDVVQELNRLLTGGKGEMLEGVSPFRGLLPFEEEHSTLYFGREVEITSFVERLRHESLIPIVGPSGAGKSSFVKAGIIPRLREKGPLILLQIRPGREPFRALASRLLQAVIKPTNSMAGNFGFQQNKTISGVHEPMNGVDNLAQQLFEQPHQLGLWLNRIAEQHRAFLVLFVDQLEELCTIQPKKQVIKEFSTSSGSLEIYEKVGVQSRFMQAITSASDDPDQPIRVILTLREEFLIRLMTSTKVRDALSRIMALRKPSEKTLIEILNRTVKSFGYKFEDFFLAQEMVRSLIDSQSILSLIQFSGQILWQNRDKQRKVLTRAAYGEMGGVTGALIQHADGVLKGLSKKEVDIGKKLFLRLVTEDKTKKIISRAELLSGLGESAERVLQRLIEARLVISSRKTKAGGEVTDDAAGDCEIVHEALFTQWERLKLWIEESREELILLNQLSQAAELWKKRGKRKDDLWSKQALKETEAVLDQAISQGTLYSNFIQESQRQIRRGKNRLAVVFGFILFALFGAVWIGSHFLRAELCTGAEEKISTVWNPRVKEKINKAFWVTGISYAKDTANRVQKLFDSYTKEWASHYTQACEATHIKGDQSDEVLDLRMGCLKMRLRELKALVEVFSRADTGVVEKAVQASSSFKGIAICADEEALRAPYPPPESEEAKVKVAAIREKLVRVEALYKTGKYRDGLNLVKKLEKETAAVDYRPVQAELLYQLGKLSYATGEYKTAENTLYESTRVAALSRDGRLVGNIMSFLVFVVGYAQGRPDDGLLIGKNAEIDIQLSGGDETLLSRLFHNIGSVYFGLANYDNALTYYRKALAIDEKTLGPEDLGLAMSLNNMGAVFDVKGQYEKALDCHLKVLKIREKVLGSDHPEVAQSLHNLGIVFGSQGDHDKALMYFRKALVVKEKMLGSNHPEMVVTLFSIGKALVDQGLTEQALTPLERAVSICEKTTCIPENHGRGLFALAQALVKTGRNKSRAIKLTQQAREIFVKNPKAFKKDIEEINTWLQKHGAKKLAKKP